MTWNIFPSSPLSRTWRGISLKKVLESLPQTSSAAFASLCKLFKAWKKLYFFFCALMCTHASLISIGEYTLHIDTSVHTNTSLCIIISVDPLSLLVKFSSFPEKNFFMNKFFFWVYELLFQSYLSLSYGQYACVHFIMGKDSYTNACSFMTEYQAFFSRESTSEGRLTRFNVDTRYAPFFDGILSLRRLWLFFLFKYIVVP